MKTKELNELKKSVTITLDEFIEKCARATSQLMSERRDLATVYALTSVALVHFAAIEIFGEDEGDGGADA